jgi:hypothetical protein
MLLDCKEQERAIVKGYCEVKIFFFSISATRETVAGVLYGSFAMVGS